jgi:hypothetical protein
MTNPGRLIYLHGSESDSNTGKARQSREGFPDMFTPDITGSFLYRTQNVFLFQPS